MIGVVESGAIVATRGGTAIGQLQVPPQKATAGQPVRLAPRPPPLAGREVLLAQLDARLSAGDGRSPRIVSLCGLGGAGKTSAAVEYAYQHLAEVGVAWQLAAEDATVLAAGFGELAAQLGARGLADVRDPVASVHAVLAGFPASWLLIFDNAADVASVAAFLPPAGPGRVLITSQNPDWPGQVMDVPVLNPDVAEGFLISRTGDPDRTTARNLADLLGGLPLALEQAAAYIRATRAAGMTLAGYLSLFRGRAADLLARGQAAGHPASVAATLGLALSRLGDEAPPAAGLLQLLACLAPEPVPVALLLSDAHVAGELAPGVAAMAGPLLGDPVAAGDAIAALRRYSLVTPAGDGLVLVHRLVQAVTLARVSADVVGQWKQAAAALVEAAVPADTTVPAAWPACSVLLPHARAVLDLTSDGIRRIAQYMGYSGSYPAARDLQQRVLKAQEQCSGPEHQATLVARASLAHWTAMAGDAAGARDQFAALLPVRERVLGPEHPHTLTARANLARWTGEAGDAAGARDQFAALLPVDERVLGPEHPETLSARGHLAGWTGRGGGRGGGPRPVRCAAPGGRAGPWLRTPGNAGRPRQPCLLDRAGGGRGGGSRPVCGAASRGERVLGREHPHTLTARANLAGWAGEAGDAAGARDQNAALLPGERVLGPEHPDTLGTRANLARWTGEAGDPAAARDQFTGLLPVFERVLGPGHPDTLGTRANLARWTGQAERDLGTQV